MEDLDGPIVTERIKPEEKPQKGGLGFALSSRAGRLILVLAFLALAAALLFYMAHRLWRRTSVVLPNPSNIDASITATQEVLKRDPQDIDALTRLGILHFQKGQDSYADAINELEGARDLGALDARIFYCLGIMYQEVGLYPFAIDEYQRYLRHYPDDKNIRLLEAKLLFQQERFPEALSEYERLRARYPSDPIIVANLALSLWKTKASDQALEVLGELKSMGAGPQRLAQFYTGRINFEQGHFQEALTHLLLCAPSDQPDAGIVPTEYYELLATTYRKLGKLEEAKDAWENLLRLDPKNAKAPPALREIKRHLPAAKKAEHKT